MGDHTVSIAGVTPPPPWTVGDQVKVKLKATPPLKLGKSAKVTLRCAAWATPEAVVDVRSTAFVKGTFARAGQAELRLAGVQGALTGTAITTGEVQAQATVAFAPEPIAELSKAPGTPHGIKLGVQNLRLAVKGRPAGKGARVRLTCEAFEEPAEARIPENDPSPLAQVLVAFQDPARPVEVTLEAVEGCALEGGAAKLTTTIHPVAPKASLAWKTPADADRTFLAGETVELQLALDAPVQTSAELVLRSETGLDGKKKAVPVKKGGAAPRPLPVTLSKKLEEGTCELLLARVSGDVLVDEQRRLLRVKVAPPLSVSFPDTGWITPESKKGYVTGETVRLVARLNQPAPSAGEWAKVTVGSDPPRALTWDAGTQDSQPVEVELTTFDTKTKVTLEGKDDTVQVGPHAEKTIAVHQANRVLFAERTEKPKPPHYPGDTVEVTVKLKYPLVLTEDQKARGERQAEVGTISGPANLLVADVPVRMDEGAQELAVTLELGPDAPGGKHTLTLTPSQGFRAKGKKGGDTATRTLEVGSARSLELVGSPWVTSATGKTVDITFCYPDEPVSFSVATSAKVATVTDAGKVVLTLGALRGEAPIRFDADTDQAVAVWNGTFTTTPAPGTATTGAMKLTLEPATGFTTKPVKTSKRRSQAKTGPTLERRALPTLRFADAPWPADLGVTAPTQATTPGGTGTTTTGTAWTAPAGLRAALRLTLDPAERPPTAGVSGGVACAAFEGGRVDLPGITLDSWLRSGVAHQDVEVKLITPSPAGTPPLAANEAKATIDGVRNAKAPVATQGGASPTLTLRIDTAPVIGFAASGWLVRPGAPPDQAERPLVHGETVTIVLDVLGSKPTAPPTGQEVWEARLTSPALERPVVVRRLDLRTPEADQVFADRKLEVEVTFDKRAATSTAITLLFGVPPPPPRKGPPGSPPPPAPTPLETYAGIKRGTSSRTLRFTKSLDLQLEPFDDGELTRPAGPFLPGDEVTLRLSLSELPEPPGDAATLTLVKLKSLCFNPPPLPGGQKPAPGAPPVPGVVALKKVTLVPGTKVYESTFVVQKAPLEPDVEVALVEEPTSPFVPLAGEKAVVWIRVLPLPVLTVHTEQPGFTSTTAPTTPPPQVV